MHKGYVVIIDKEGFVIARVKLGLKDMTDIETSELYTPPESARIVDFGLDIAESMSNPRWNGAAWEDVT